MAIDCAGVDVARQDALDGGPSAALPPEVAVHVAGCPACRALEADLARVDALLASEPAPAAPRDLLATVMEAVQARRARDLAWARLQGLVVVAAALLLVTALGALTGGWSSPAAWPGALASACADLGDAAGMAWGALLERLPGAGSLSGPLPSPPLVVLLVLGPALLALDWVVARRAGVRA